jgi:uncharacterized membrane protein
MLSNRHKKLFWLLVGWTAFIALLIFVRIAVCRDELDLPGSYSQLKMTRGLTYAFLGWNLVLAWVPYLISLYATRLHQVGASRFWVWSIAILWLLFLPNAPYIVTDLLHLHAKPPVPLWFDVILLFSAAWTGLLLGFISLRQMHKIIADRVQNRFWEHSLVIGILALTGYGVWLGRFHRWNSWDIVSRPHRLFVDIFHSLTQNPVAAHAWTISGVLFVFLTLGYYTLLTLSERRV